MGCAHIENPSLSISASLEELFKYFHIDDSEKPNVCPNLLNDDFLGLFFPNSPSIKTTFLFCDIIDDKSDAPDLLDEIMKQNFS